MMLRVGLGLSLCVVMSACGSEEATRVSQPVLRGQEDTVTTGVVAIDIVPALQSGVGFCSGFMISDRLVVTARHCVSEDLVPGGTAIRCEDRAEADGGVASVTRIGATIPTTSFVVNNDPRGVAAAPAFVKEVLVPPGTSGERFCGNDLAILWLAQSLPGAKPIAPRLDAPPTVGEPVLVVGYGNDGADATSGGTRRSVSGSQVESVGETMLNGVVRTTGNEWTVDVGPCKGDSGGPALDASGRAIGIMSRGPLSTCQSIVETRLDPFAKWLVDTARTTAEADGLPPPAWTEPPVDAGVPDAGAAAPTPTGGCNTSGVAPSHFAAIVAAALASARRRRGRSRGRSA